jgi:hypothetical protein
LTWKFAQVRAEALLFAFPFGKLQSFALQNGKPGQASFHRVKKIYGC